jgi:hypothetical protein
MRAGLRARLFLLQAPPSPLIRPDPTLELWAWLEQERVWFGDNARADHASRGFIF